MTDDNNIWYCLWTLSSRFIRVIYEDDQIMFPFSKYKIHRIVPLISIHIFIFRNVSWNIVPANIRVHILCVYSEMQMEFLELSYSSYIRKAVAGECSMYGHFVTGENRTISSKNWIQSVSPNFVKLTKIISACSSPTSIVWFSRSPDLFLFMLCKLINYISYSIFMIPTCVSIVWNV